VVDNQDVVSGIAPRNSPRNANHDEGARSAPERFLGGPYDEEEWVRSMKTVSTSPPQRIFTKDAETIAKAMASRKVSPKGIGSGVRMIHFFIRAGKDLPASRRRELEKAKRILQAKAKKKNP
jgi:Protein of unknown function (DUF3175)